MPMIKCPNCGRSRLVVEGKRKKCRKCGTPLTVNLPKLPKAEPAKELTIDDLKSQHPDQVAEIVKAARAEALAEAAGKDPDVKAAVKKAVEKAWDNFHKKVDKMTVPKFTEMFPKIWGKIEKSFAKKAKNKSK